MNAAAATLANLTPAQRRALLATLLQRKAAGGEGLPLSFGEESLWVAEQLAPGNPIYNMAVAGRLRGHFSLEVLDWCLREIERRHEILRTIFPVVDGRPVRVISPTPVLSLELRDIGHVPVEEREATMQSLLLDESLRPFDLGRGPLVRLRLVRLEPDHHVLLVVAHHIVCDGWSTAVFLGEFAALYEGYRAGRPSPLPELPIQYLDYAHWQRQRLTGATVEAELEFWRRRLTGAPEACELPSDRTRPSRPTYRGGRESRLVPAETEARLNELSHAARATPFMALLAALQTLIGHYTHQEDVVVGTNVANRSRLELEGLIGFFVNQLVLRTSLAGDPTFRELVGRARDTCLESYAHQELPFDRVLSALRPSRDRARPPLFQIKISPLPPRMPKFEGQGLQLEPLDVLPVTIGLDLIVFVEQIDGRLALTWEYNSDLFEAATIRRMLGRFEELIEHGCRTPELRLSELGRLIAAADEENLRRLREAVSLRRRGSRRARSDESASEVAPATDPEAKEESHGDVRDRSC